MRYELKLHRFTFGIMAFLLIAFVAFVFRISSGLADERLEVIASLAIVVVAAAAFVIIGMVEGTMAFQFGRPHKRELLSYLVLGVLSLASGLYLAVSDEASLQTIALVAAPMLCCLVWHKYVWLNIWSATQRIEEGFCSVV